MRVTTGATTATITADDIIVETALGGLRYCQPSPSATINLANGGVINRMLSGTATASGWLGIYSTYNPTTGLSGVFGVMESGAALPTIAASTISGYTATALGTVVSISATPGQFSSYQSTIALYRLCKVRQLVGSLPARARRLPH